MKIKVNSVNEVNWKELNVKSSLPEGLKKLDEIAHNLWWVWNSDAKNLYRHLDNAAWVEAGSNPIRQRNIVNYEKLVQLSENKEFTDKLDRIYSNFKSYMSVPFDSKKPSVAYFSMEYGLVDILKIYSGGLGVLAGDYLK
jgi:starch phosphorylase